MSGTEAKWKTLQWVATVVLSLLLVSVFASAERTLKDDASRNKGTAEVHSNYLVQIKTFIWQAGKSGYHHVWPPMKFGWEIVLGTIIGFCGAAFGSVGGVGGGGIFVPMLTLIIGFDAKSSTAISKCMIMGASASTVYCNLRLRHPTLDMPIIDYDLAMLFQPMLMLGISIGVAFNVIFANWMLTVLLIVLFLGLSTKSFFKGIETWKKETIKKKEAAKRLESNGTSNEQVEHKIPPSSTSNGPQKETKESREREVPILKNVYWKELGLLVFVWVAFLILQIVKNHTTTCSTIYWVLNLLQIPVAVGVSLYEGVSLYKGWKVIGSKGDKGTNWRVHQLILYCCCGILAGVVGGLLGLGGGFILGPLFLEMGVPPEVSSATATFAMMFSSSMSVVEYYLLKRFPIPYGQRVVRRLIILLGRASLIIFILSLTIFVSAISLGGIGISRMIHKIERHEYMGLENLCNYNP
uniref:Sulfite exporter TauE/SafE family protein 3-like n=1 Tax=Nelumbo nucifera TaxID=4432 RepID=A0A822ZIF8_NELNU|nr:TPA_asm: hypothetical protein HUJ06_002887 [Nelumbo nucifera]